MRMTSNLLLEIKHFICFMDNPFSSGGEEKTLTEVELQDSYLLSGFVSGFCKQELY